MAGPEGEMAAGAARGYPSRPGYIVPRSADRPASSSEQRYPRGWGKPGVVPDGSWPAHWPPGWHEDAGCGPSHDGS